MIPVSPDFFDLELLKVHNRDIEKDPHDENKPHSKYRDTEDYLLDHADKTFPLISAPYTLIESKLFVRA